MKKVFFALMLTFSFLLIPQTSHAEWIDVASVDSWSYVDREKIILYAYNHPVCVVEAYYGTFSMTSKIILPKKRLEENNPDYGTIIVDGKEIQITKVSSVRMSQPVNHL